MKQFIKTKFFLALQEASQKGFDLDNHALQKWYDEFVLLLFAGSTAFPDVVTYRNVLVYTRVELAGLTKGAGKKCSNFSQKSHWTCRYTDRMGRKATVIGTKSGTISEKNQMDRYPNRVCRVALCFS